MEGRKSGGETRTSKEGVVIISGLDGEGDIWSEWLWHVHVLREPVVLDT